MTKRIPCLMFQYYIPFFVSGDVFEEWNPLINSESLPVVTT